MLQKLKVRWDSLSQESKAATAFMIAGIMQKGIQMLVTPVFTRIMTTEEYGIYSTYNAWYQILYIFATLKIAVGVYTQGLVKFDKDKDRFQSSLLGLSVTLIGIFTLVFILLRTFISNLLGLAPVFIYAMLCDFIADASYQLWQRRQQNEVKWKKLILLSVTNTVLVSSLGILGVWHSSNKPEARVLITVGIDLVLFIPLLVIQFRKNHTFFNLYYWKYAILFCLPLIPHYLAQVVLNQADRIMIKNICGESEAGIYSLAYSLAFTVQVINEAINKALDPWLYKQIKTKNYRKMEKMSYQLMVLVGIVNMALIVFAPEIIFLFAPKEYYSAIWVIPPVACSVYFIFMYNFFADFEFYYEKTKWISMASLFGAVLNLVLNAIFIPRYGFLAAGYTTLVCYLVYVIAHFIFMRRICRQFLADEKVYNGKIIFLVSIGMLAIASICMMLYNHIIIKYSIVLVVCGILFLCRKKIIEIVRNLKNG